jgi:hypothetical protein
MGKAAGCRRQAMLQRLPYPLTQDGTARPAPCVSGQGWQTGARARCTAAVESNEYRLWNREEPEYIFKARIPHRIASPTNDTPFLGL